MLEDLGGKVIAKLVLPLISRVHQQNVDVDRSANAHTIRDDIPNTERPQTPPSEALCALG